MPAQLYLDCGGESYYIYLDDQWYPSSNMFFTNKDYIITSDIPDEWVTDPNLQQVSITLHTTVDCAWLYNNALLKSSSTTQTINSNVSIGDGSQLLFHDGVSDKALLGYHDYNPGLPAEWKAVEVGCEEYGLTLNTYDRGDDNVGKHILVNLKNSGGSAPDELVAYMSDVYWQKYDVGDNVIETVDSIDTVRAPKFSAETDTQLYSTNRVSNFANAGVSLKTVNSQSNHVSEIMATSAFVKPEQAIDYAGMMCSDENDPESLIGSFMRVDLSGVGFYSATSNLPDYTTTTSTSCPVYITPNGLNLKNVSYTQNTTLASGESFKTINTSSTVMSMLYNEADGGGSQLQNLASPGVNEMYVGTNSDGDSGGLEDFVEIYAKTTSGDASGTGTRLFTWL
jgi:hypothetical protein